MVKSLLHLSFLVVQYGNSSVNSIDFFKKTIQRFIDCVTFLWPINGVIFVVVAD